MRVASLHVYPVKGARGIALERAEVLTAGIRHDRRFMVLDAGGTIVTQREHPRMALVEVALGDGRMTLFAPGSTARATVPLEPDGPLRRVRIWNDEVDAVDVSGEAAAFFSEHLAQRCSVVFMPYDVLRPVEEPYGRPEDRVGFADAYPLLVASLASLADLNARLEATGSSPVPMDRFRPSIVVEGGDPYAEDRATRMRIGSLVVRTPKRCSRCQVTTVDQKTAEKGKEPLKTLATYRAENDKVYFAVNAIPELGSAESATIAVGDDVTYE
jgi:uncharacterized protein YcbX